MKPVLTIEELEKEVMRLFGNDNISMPILLLPPSNTRKKVSIRHRKLTTSTPRYSIKLGRKHANIRSKIL